jgi:hypothetical protein
LKFFFCYGLTWDDVFDWHDWNFTPLPSTTRYASGTMSPKGERLTPPETKVALLWTITIAITRSAPFPHRPRMGIWEGRGDRSLPFLISYHSLRSGTMSPFSFSFLLLFNIIKTKLRGFLGVLFIPLQARLDIQSCSAR